MNQEKTNGWGSMMSDDRSLETLYNLPKDGRAKILVK